MSRWLFLPNSVEKDLQTLAKLSPDRVEQLISVFNSDTGKKRRATSLQIAEHLDIEDEEAAGIYAFWRFVQDERSEFGKTGSDVIHELVDFLRAKASRASSTSQAQSFTQTAISIEKNHDSLAQLFGDYPERAKARKVAALGLGPLPHFVNMKILCDIRPIYDESAETIEKNAAILTLRIVSHGNYDEYHDSIINITEEDISSIEEEIGRVKKKLAVLRQRYPDVVTRTPYPRSAR